MRAFEVLKAQPGIDLVPPAITAGATAYVRNGKIAQAEELLEAQPSGASQPVFGKTCCFWYLRFVRGVHVSCILLAHACMGRDILGAPSVTSVLPSAVAPVGRQTQRCCMLQF